ncbi:helix-turn-helix transcriptional regulator [Pseudaminobacter soli (ex Li et al. 2025)]|uniref:helix-turn-helix transcriptional regulator n=1 Tax=Pseudaminobacter soli (ex Li et al. 2025) TaxID=1295366 RepID=UPI002472F53B|nr:helix-turn-helix transcriptional regulator [Mesorhizobium soli]
MTGISPAFPSQSAPQVRGVDRTNVSDDELIDLIYASLLGEASWQKFLDRLSEGLPDGASTLFFHDPHKNAGGISLSTGFSDQALAAYGSHYASVNPMMKGATTRPLGLGVLAEQMYARDRLVKSEYYSDFMRANGLESAVGVTIYRENGCSFLLSTLTSSADLENNRLAADRLTRLAPHLQRAFRHYRAGPFQKAVTEIGGSLFDAIDVGLVIVGSGMQVKTASATGERMLADGAAIGTSPLGQLTLRSSEAMSLLRTMLETGFEGRTVQSRSIGPFKLTFILVQKDRVSTYFEGPTAIVLVEPPHAGSRAVDFEHLARAYNLTAAEMRAMTGIVLGRSIDEIAADAGLSRETIRTQLKNVYAKTGATRQADLVRLATRGILPARQ